MFRREGSSLSGPMGSYDTTLQKQPIMVSGPTAEGGTHDIDQSECDEEEEEDEGEHMVAAHR